MASLKFKRRTNGTGTVLSTTHLGFDEGANHVEAEYTFDPQGPLVRVVCKVFYFATLGATPTDAQIQAARLLAAKRVESLRTSLLHRPMIVKPLARGKSMTVNLHNNYGDLVQTDGSASPQTDEVILDNCTLESATVDDDVGLRGVGLQLVFARVSDSHKVS